MLPVPETMLSTTDVAHRLGVTPETVRRWTKAGYLKLHRRTPGNHRQYKQSDVDALIASMEHPQGAA